MLYCCISYKLVLKKYTDNFKCNVAVSPAMCFFRSQVQPMGSWRKPVLTSPKPRHCQRLIQSNAMRWCDCTSFRCQRTFTTSGISASSFVLMTPVVRSLHRHQILFQYYWEDRRYIWHLINSSVCRRRVNRIEPLGLVILSQWKFWMEGLWEKYSVPAHHLRIPAYN